jgi:hypothetical protein
MSQNNTILRVRMYRHGLGDCFLLTFSRQGRDDFNLMIDCGLLQGTRKGKEIMQKVVRDVEASLGVSKTVSDEEKKWLDVVVLTHEHADHISGFSQAQDVFERIHFGEVWAGWTEDKQHPDYKAVRERFHKQVVGLRAALEKMNSDEYQGLKEAVHDLVYDFFEDDVLGAKAKGSDRPSAWEYALGKSVKPPRYCRPGESFLLEGLDDVRIYILGPPEKYETFTKVNPPADETYRHEGNNFALADSFFAAVAGDGDIFEGELYQPFEQHLRIDPEREAPLDDFFKTHYGFGESDEDGWRRIGDDWLTMAGGLALNLDSYTNNTCLAFAIEFAESGRVLLFPGDAQFANWISWQNLSWEVPDDKGGKRSVKTEDLLKRTVLYKVGHHGSHNATLKRHGLEMMTHPDLAAIIPVDREKAKSKVTKTNPNGWEMPEEFLFNRLLERTCGRVILADESDHAELQARCKDKKFLSSVEFLGEFVRDEDASTETEPLCVQLTIEG